jgi:D-aminoacyl-tRNA deacylase
MRAMIQRVKEARVQVDGKIVSEIGPGILSLLGIARGDTEEQLQKTIKKICELRIFEDELGKMNLSLLDTKGSHLIVSQFTLLGDSSKGRRPSFIEAEEPVRAKELYEKGLKFSEKLGIPTQGGIFQAHMLVELTNDGPVTLLIEN